MGKKKKKKRARKRAYSGCLQLANADFPAKLSLLEGPGEMALGAQRWPVAWALGGGGICCTWTAET